MVEVEEKNWVREESASQKKWKAALPTNKAVPEKESEKLNATRHEEAAEKVAGTENLSEIEKLRKNVDK